jgi:hypothetical protein
MQVARLIDLWQILLTFSFFRPMHFSSPKYESEFCQRPNFLPLQQNHPYHPRQWSGLIGYDGIQNRISKAVKTGLDTTFTFYVRDAQGNVMGVYTRTRAATPTITWAEQYLYGSGCKQSGITDQARISLPSVNETKL